MRTENEKVVLEALQKQKAEYEWKIKLLTEEIEILLHK
jgi:hypothetical protein